MLIRFTSRIHRTANRALRIPTPIRLQDGVIEIGPIDPALLESISGEAILKLSFEVNRIPVFTSATPLERLESLLVEVQSLPLGAGLPQSLRSVVRQARRLLNDSNQTNNTAVRLSLEAWVRHLEAADTLPEATRAELQEEAESILDLL